MPSISCLFIQLMDLQPLRSQVPLSQTFPSCVSGRSLSPVLGVSAFRSLMTAGNLSVENQGFMGIWGCDWRGEGFSEV